jgi:PAS domain S-box-containing protein
MKDNDKTKGELIAELAELRHRIGELETCEVERKRAQEETHKLTRHLESVIDNANVLFDAIDREGNVLLWNRATEVITGYSREEVVGHNKVWKCLYPDREYRRAIAAKAGEVVEGRIVEDMETTIRTKRGEDRTLSWYVRNLVDKEGDPVGAVWLGTDITERREAEKALKASEEQSRTLVENANEAIVVAQDDVLKFVNPKATELAGYSREELTSKPFAEFIHPDDREMVVERHLTRLKGDQLAFVYPFRIVDKEGDIKWMEISAVLIQWEGRPATLNFLSDITERKRAEEEVRRSEAKYHSLVEDTSVGIVSIDLTGNFTFVNAAICQMLGYPKNELVGQPFASLVHPDSIETIMPMFLGALREPRGKADIEFRAVGRRGQVMDLWASVTHMRQDNQTIGFNAIVTDVSERRRAEEQLRQSEEKLRTMVENAHDVIFQLSPSGIIQYVSPKVREIYGSKPEDVVGQHLTKTTPADELPKALEALKTVLSGRALKNFEINQLDSKGNVVPVELNLGPVEREGEVVAVQGVMRDITERKKAEERINASLNEKEVLLQEIHHRVKNNLQVMSSLLKLQSGYIKDERYAEMLKESQNRVKTMALIHEKLYQSEDLARIDLGGYIKSLVRGLFSAYGAEAGRIALRTEVEDISLGVDYAMPCGLVINELVSNSLKHAFPDGKKGEIKIAMRPIGRNEVELVVSDNGIGIPASLDFRNAESLGLRLVSMLAEDQLGGQVELDRTCGTRFEIRFGVAE